MGVQFTHISKDRLEATMPVDHRSMQPYGLLHGGASVFLAESVGSVFSNLLIDSNKSIAVGLEINANHIKSVKEGVVKATAEPIHIGRSTHLWNIRITNDKEELVCISRLTVAIIDKPLKP